MEHWIRGAAAVLIGMVALACTGCSVMPGRPDPTHITADFRSISGMFAGNPVTVLGLRVGTVDKIVPHPRFAEVHMSIDHDVTIPENVTAALISQSIVTDRHIELSPAYTGGRTLTDGAHLTVESTRSPVELDTLLQTIDTFTAALAPPPGSTQGPLSGTLLYDMLDGRGAKIHDTLTALTGALRVGVVDGDAISQIVVQLNDLTSMLADNDASVREFGNNVTRMSTLLAEQSTGLAATLDQLEAVLANTGTTFGAYRDRLADSLTGLTTATDQLRANASQIIESTDVIPLLSENLDRLVDRPGRFGRAHALIGTVSGEIVSTFCARIELRADGCRTGRVQDLGPDFGLTAAMLGLTR
ncbi:MCE family protein [Nocardia sp. CA2R105]|uniref:MCE family protein n=1 Tax=Nocardia coffeae TaxID=2873381 RepID=UPI001CA5FA01|nr:MCE family protein [Nocardia coffeae]MBY8862139.1 MCE family protein [Nocardia coffeae]